MAANITPIFVVTPHIGMVRFATGNSNRDGTGTLADVITGAAFGTRVDRIIVKSTVTTTTGMIRFYIYDGASATRLWREEIVSAVTASGTATSYEKIILSPDIGQPLLVLPSGYVLKVSTVNAETFDCLAHGGDF